MNLRIESNINRVSPRYVEAYKGITPATLGHMAGIRFMHYSIKPVFSRVQLVGPAVTVYSPGSDVGIIEKVPEVARPGDVIVVDRGGDVQRACIGEFRALRDIQRGIAGWVIDGSATDVVELADMRFPVFCKAASALLGQLLDVEGYINGVIQCGGVPVRPGELIVADDNGIAVLSEEEAERYMDDALRAEERERNMRPKFAKEYKQLVK
jgi:regulator of RNase E activity RraA